MVVPSTNSRNHRVPLEDDLRSRPVQEASKSSRPGSSLESDQDFRFKRHKNNQLVGVPSLGERLDNLQSTRDPRWIDNFNSSLPISSAPRNQGLPQNLNNNKYYNNSNSNAVSQLSSSQQLYSDIDGNLDTQIQNQNSWMQQNSHQSRQQLQLQPQQVYYIPVQTSPHMFSSQHQMQSPFMNQSVQFMPNSSLQPFYPNQLQPQPQPQPQPEPEPQPTQSQLSQLQLQLQPQPHLLPQYSSQQALISQPLPRPQSQRQVPTPTQVDLVQRPQSRQQTRLQAQQPAVQNPSSGNTHLLPPFHPDKDNNDNPSKNANSNNNNNNNPTKHTTNLQYVQNTRRVRKSLAEQRGRRLSQLSNRDQMIISPHRDVPEDEFYRHLGNTSFATNLQLRQLFTWCAIRTLAKMQKRNAEMERRFGDVKEGSERMFVESRRIALGIIRSFVSDLRKDLLNIDWDGELEVEVGNAGGSKDVGIVTETGTRQGADLGREDKAVHSDERGQGSEMELDADKPDLEELFENEEDRNQNQNQNNGNNDTNLDDNGLGHQGVRDDGDADDTYYYNGLNIKSVQKTKEKRKIEQVQQNEHENNLSSKYNYDGEQESIGLGNKKRKDETVTKKVSGSNKLNSKLLPNSKNVKNEQNLIILQDKVNVLKEELDSWVRILGARNPDTEWGRIEELHSNRHGYEQEVARDIKHIEVPSTEELSSDLSERLGSLRVHTHLLKSNVDALTLLTKAKTDMLAKELVFPENGVETPSERKQLLRGLSALLAKK